MLNNFFICISFASWVSCYKLCSLSPRLFCCSLMFCQALILTAVCAALQFLVVLQFYKINTDIYFTNITCFTNNFLPLFFFFFWYYREVLWGFLYIAINLFLPEFKLHLDGES